MVKYIDLDVAIQNSNSAFFKKNAKVGNFFTQKDYTPR